MGITPNLAEMVSQPLVTMNNALAFLVNVAVVWMRFAGEYR
jgi:hypothetical protein